MSMTIKYALARIARSSGGKSYQYTVYFHSGTVRSAARKVISKW